MADPDPDRVPGGAPPSRTAAQPYSVRARAGKKSNPATSPGSHERHHANSGKPTVAEVRSDSSPLLRTSASTTVERPLSETYSPTRFNSTAASNSPEDKDGAVRLPQSIPRQPTHGNQGEGSSPTHPQLPDREPWNQSPQSVAQAQPVNNSASGRPTHSPATAQLTHTPTHISHPNDEQQSADEGIETGCDLASPVSPDGHIPRARVVKGKIPMKV